MPSGIDLAIVAERSILLPLALVTIWLTAPGIAATWRGSLSLTDKSNAGAFAFGCSTLIGQIFFLLWPQPLVLVLALLCAIVAHGLMVRVRLTARKQGLPEIERLMSRPDLTLPMLDLADVDEEQAQVFRRSITTAIARKLADG